MVETDDNLLAIGSGGFYAFSAAKALLENSDMSARDIVEKSLSIAADVCVFTNHNRVIKEIDSIQPPSEDKTKGEEKEQNND